jgi:hypothetical protein
MNNYLIDSMYASIHKLPSPLEQPISHSLFVIWAIWPLPVYLDQNLHGQTLIDSGLDQICGLLLPLFFE